MPQDFPDTSMKARSIMDRATEIATSYLARNQMEPEMVPRLIEKIGQSLIRVEAMVSGEGQLPAPVAEKEPPLETVQKEEPEVVADAGAVEPEIPFKGIRRPDSPAVPIADSVTPDFLICLEDGQQMKMLKRYLNTRYGMTPEEYRSKWGLPEDYPMLAPNYSRVRSTIAKTTGFQKDNVSASKKKPVLRAVAKTAKSAAGKSKSKAAKGKAAEATAVAATAAEAPKRRGRPPKAKTTEAAAQTEAPKRRGRPPKAKTEATAAPARKTRVAAADKAAVPVVQAEAPAQVETPKSATKARKQPVKAKKAVGARKTKAADKAAAPVVQAEAPAQAEAPKRRGRPPKTAKTAVTAERKRGEPRKTTATGRKRKQTEKAEEKPVVVAAD